MFEVEMLIGPIVGGAIGFVTNSLAIKMLFRPLRPIVIFGKTMPFTPGMIPKEQKRIAAEIGRVVESELLDLEILKSKLRSPEIYSCISHSIHSFMDSLSEIEVTLQEYLESDLQIQDINFYKSIAVENISVAITKSIQNSNISEVIVNEILNALKDHLGPLKMFVGDSFIATISEKAKELINQFIRDRIYDYVFNSTTEEVDKFFDQPMSEFAQKLMEYEDLITDMANKIYTKFIDTQVESILQKINIAQVIEEKVKNYSPAKLEQLILQVVQKELNAIIYLGIVLGAIIGCLM
ncbi:MAG: hypothetical protein ATN31_09295 [Candidatus Epulonipiscioides saccharophilum]|nr:MAG: hypothetical protein ATN31_09295 [Epulopiscium sp. AS2M-Bin001]